MPKSIFDEKRSAKCSCHHLKPEKSQIAPPYEFHWTDLGEKIHPTNRPSYRSIERRRFPVYRDFTNSRRPENRNFVYRVFQKYWCPPRISATSSPSAFRDTFPACSPQMRLKPSILGIYVIWSPFRLQKGRKNSQNRQKTATSKSITLHQLYRFQSGLRHDATQFALRLS